MSLRRLLPILHDEARHAGELTHVVRHEHCAQRERTAHLSIRSKPKQALIAFGAAVGRIMNVAAHRERFALPRYAVN